MPASTAPRLSAVLLLLLPTLGCQPDPLDDTGAGDGVAGDSGGGGDDGDTGGGSGDDTGGGDDTGEDGPWPPLDPEAHWVSTDRGVATGLAWADMDRDGDPDLVVAYGNDIEPGRLVVYDNDDGELSEEPGSRTASDHYFGHLSVGDVDGDGWPDVAVSRFLGDAGWSAPGGVQVYRNDAGVLEEHPSWEIEGFQSFSCALGDRDNDGDLDLAVAVGEPYQHDPDLSLVFDNDGTGDFGEGPAWTMEAPRHAMDVGWVDLDDDGFLDLVFATEPDPHVAYLNPGGVLSETPDWEAPVDGSFEGNTLDWGDVDGDGLMDLVISDNDQKGGPGVVRLYCGAELALCWTQADDPDYQSAVSLEDVDGDGHLDLVAGAWWGAVRLYRGDGSTLEAEPSWTSEKDDIVVEAFDWADADGSHWREATVSGTGLVAVPGRGRVLSVEGGVAGFGYASGPGALTVRYLEARARDLAVSDWTKGSGNRVYGRE